MTAAIRNFLRFIVFRNVFIACCAACMVWETQWFFRIPMQFSGLLIFIFSATFFEYNLHVIGGRISIFHPLESLKIINGPGTSTTLRLCIFTGFIFTTITFFLLDKIMMAGFIISGLLTLSYTLPMIRQKGKFIRVREITYLKVFTVALGWTLITVVVPLLPILQNISKQELTIIMLRRFLFIYAITIPFEIRDMERERKFGNISLPMIYGVRMMKIVGIVMLLLFCMLCAFQEKYFLFDLTARKSILLPLLISAVAAAILILNASDKKTNWYFKFWTDGTMILQFLLLLLFDQR
ncbi:MAG: hypothetical protein ABI763_13630 [Bacteroidota bacterium]